ncbi:MAG TPA: phosphotransferase family protein [Bacillales bacterium]|nr:phosphotransferase family protein [Bacillales bacterium]
MEKQRVQSVDIDGLNWDVIAKFLQANIEGLSNCPIEVQKFPAGYSNLTYLIKIGEWEAVLRRPPFGMIPPKAHDMEREYRILSKLYPVFPLAPKPYLYCENPSIMEKHFYVMEKKDGHVLDEELPAEYGSSEQVGKTISEVVIDTLVNLHEIDIEKANLMDIGKSDGYLERQVKGWIKRYHQSKTDEILGTEEIENYLTANIPASPKATIVHNDFKLNNMMFDRNDPGKVVGVFDWELCTVGDPLTDLGSTLAYWTEQDEAETGLTSVTDQPGFLRRKDLVELYAKKSNRDLSNIDYYITFAFYKIAVILQQIYYRYKMGEIQDERFKSLNIGINNLIYQSVNAKNRTLLR